MKGFGLCLSRNVHVYHVNNTILQILQGNTRYRETFALKREECFSSGRFSSFGGRSGGDP